MYAGFWRRFVAWLIDGALVAVVLFVPIFIMAICIGLFAAADIADSIARSYELSSTIDTESTGAAAALVAFVGIVSMAIVGFVGQGLYFALMESSKHQATLGKLIVGIKVTDMAGNRLTFGRAVGRYLGKLLHNFIPCGGFIGAIFIGVTEKKQGIHDFIASTLVVDKNADFGQNQHPPQNVVPQEPTPQEPTPQEPTPQEPTSQGVSLEKE